MRDGYARLGPSCEPAVRGSIDEMARDRVVQRIWAKDYTVWKSDPGQVANRLGWLSSAQSMQKEVPRLDQLVRRATEGGFTHALVLGMGGSSRAAESLSRIFGKREGFLELSILDSTDPDAVLAAQARLRPGKTLFIVASKSGTTVETISFLKSFHSWLSKNGVAHPGGSFVAITDPGTELASTAKSNGFLATFLNDPDIGGRYSALSHFGLVPAALLGADVPGMLEHAASAAAACGPGVEAEENPALWLGATLGELAKNGRDKATFVTCPRLEGFGGWVEQMLAESTGKDGKGILPVVGEPLEPPQAYAPDRLFFSVGLDGDATQPGQDAFLTEMAKAGHPLVSLRLHELGELGGFFFLWEMATAVAGHVIGVNPFDQPNVELTKSLTNDDISEYKRERGLPRPKPALESPSEGITVYGDARGKSPVEMLVDFLSRRGNASYVAVHAYVQPTAETNRLLHELRGWLLTRLGLATAVDYGPRFLHATGELYKGDGGTGLFIQVVSENHRDLPIPDELGIEKSSLTFGVLKEAQALGDREAMIEGGRKVITLRLGAGVQVAHALARLVEALNRVEARQGSPPPR